MRSANRMTPKVLVALVIAGVTLIGSVARSTWAQDGSSAKPPAQSVEPGPSPVTPDSPPPFTEVSKPQEPAPPGPGSAPHADSVAVRPVEPGSDDPEKSARAFVEQNRKAAQDELKKLKGEAERLRTRLGKVEAGIRRWEALVAALDQSENALASGTGSSTKAEHMKSTRWSGVEKK